MADTPTPGETTTPPVVPEDNSGVPAPSTGSTNDEAAQLRKQLEQAQMRANQLENEKAKRDKAESDAQRKSLEEKEEFKTLYEKQKAELDSIRDAEEAAKLRVELSTASETVFKEYPTDVQEVAKTAGLSLSDDSEAARAILKGKLDDIQKRVAPNSASTANNPYTPPVTETDREALVTRDPKTGVSPMAMASAEGNLRPTMQYISGLKSVQAMKKASGMQVTEI